jgi:chromosome segregation ATPase
MWEAATGEVKKKEQEIKQKESVIKSKNKEILDLVKSLKNEDKERMESVRYGRALIRRIEALKAELASKDRDVTDLRDKLMAIEAAQQQQQQQQAEGAGAEQLRARLQQAQAENERLRGVVDSLEAEQQRLAAALRVERQRLVDLEGRLGGDKGEAEAQQDEGGDGEEEDITDLKAKIEELELTNASLQADLLAKKDDDEGGEDKSELERALADEKARAAGAQARLEAELVEHKAQLERQQLTMVEVLERMAVMATTTRVVEAGKRAEGRLRQGIRQRDAKLLALSAAMVSAQADIHKLNEELDHAFQAKRCLHQEIVELRARLNTDVVVDLQRKIDDLDFKYMLDVGIAEEELAKLRASLEAANKRIQELESRTCICMGRDGQGAGDNEAKLREELEQAMHKLEEVTHHSEDLSSANTALQADVQRLQQQQEQQQERQREAEAKLREELEQARARLEEATRCGHDLTLTNDALQAEVQRLIRYQQQQRQCEAEAGREAEQQQQQLNGELRQLRAQVAQLQEALYKSETNVTNLQERLRMARRQQARNLTQQTVDAQSFIRGVQQASSTRQRRQVGPLQ